MSNKLVYKKIFIDSNYRTVQSRSSADFSIELNENIEAPEGTKCWITDVSIPAVWKTTEVGYEYLYVMVFDGDTLIKNFRHYLGNTIYFAEQLCFYMAEGMNNNTTDLSAGGIFVYAYNSATRIVEFKIKDGLTYTIKNPTDAELQNCAGGVWDTGHSNYDTRNIVSINYLLSNFVPTNPIATWTSSYLNLVPFRAVYISSSSLLDYHYSAPNSYSSSIVRKVLVDEQLGGIITDKGAPLNEDYLDIGNKNRKRLDFRITDEKGTTMNLYGIPVQFALVLGHSSY
jgi:hypothetical protein